MGIGSAVTWKAVGPAVKARLRASRVAAGGPGLVSDRLGGQGLAGSRHGGGDAGGVGRGAVAGGVADGVLGCGGGAQLGGAVPDHLRAGVGRWALGGRRLRWAGVRCRCRRRCRARAGAAAGGGDDAVGDGLGRVAAALVLAQDEEGGGHVPVAQRLLDRLPGQDHEAADLLRLRQRVDRVPGLDQGGEVGALQQVLDLGLVDLLGAGDLARRHAGGETARAAHPVAAQIGVARAAAGARDDGGAHAGEGGESGCCRIMLLR